MNRFNLILLIIFCIPCAEVSSDQSLKLTNEILSKKVRFETKPSKIGGIHLNIIVPKIKGYEPIRCDWYVPEVFDEPAPLPVFFSLNYWYCSIHIESQDNHKFLFKIYYNGSPLVASAVYVHSQASKDTKNSDTF